MTADWIQESVKMIRRANESVYEESIGNNQISSYETSEIRQGEEYELILQLT